MKKKQENSNMTMLTIFLPGEIIDTYDDLVTERIIANRSEGFRMAITDFLTRMLEVKRMAISRKNEQGESKE